jgi:hypothetical protein
MADPRACVGTKIVAFILAALYMMYGDRYQENM